MFFILFLLSVFFVFGLLRDPSLISVRKDAQTLRGGAFRLEGVKEEAPDGEVGLYVN